MNEQKITRQAGKTNAETERVGDIMTRMLAAGELPALKEALRLKELEPARTPTQPPRRQQPRTRKKQLVLVGLGNG